MLTRILFYILIVSFIVGQLGRIELGAGLAINISDIILAMTLVVWLIEEILIKRNYNIFVNELTKPLCLFISICLLSLLANFSNIQLYEFILSSLYLVRWVAYVFVFFIVYSFDQKTKLSIIKFLVLSQLLFIVLGFIQYFFYPNLRNLFYMGWDDHLYRLFSTFLDPNFAATQINLFIFFLIMIIKDDLFSLKKFKFILIILFGLSVAALLLTYSRSGYIMFILGVSISFWLLNNKRLIVILFLIFFLGVIIIPKNLGSAGIELWRTASINARTESANNALIIIKDHPIFGVGFNTYRYAQRKYGFIVNRSEIPSHSDAGTDNSFLFVWATSGILGLIIYIYIWFVILRTNFVSYSITTNKSWEKNLSILIITSISSLFLNALFINSLFYPNIMFWVWVITGFGSYNLKKIK